MTNWEDATIGLADGCPCTEMPYSTSVPITRRTLIRGPRRVVRWRSAAGEAKNTAGWRSWHEPTGVGGAGGAAPDRSEPPWPRARRAAQGHLLRAHRAGARDRLREWAQHALVPRRGHLGDRHRAVGPRLGPLRGPAVRQRRPGGPGRARRPAARPGGRLARQRAGDVQPVHGARPPAGAEGGTTGRARRWAPARARARHGARGVRTPLAAPDGACAANRLRGLPPDARRARPACVHRVAGRGPGAGLPARTGPRPAVDLRLPARGRLRRRGADGQRPRRRNPTRNSTMTTMTTMIRMVRIPPT